MPLSCLQCLFIYIFLQYNDIYYNYNPGYEAQIKK